MCSEGLSVLNVNMTNFTASSMSVDRQAPTCALSSISPRSEVQGRVLYVGTEIEKSNRSSENLNAPVPL